MVLIVGCGFLGSCVAQQCVRLFPDERVLAVVRDLKNIPSVPQAEYFSCDVTDADALQALRHRCGNEPLRVVWLSAVHNIDFVFQNPAIARKTNVDALQNFLRLFDPIERLIFSSTDCVYGEKDPPYRFREDEPLRPINQYGMQKLEAEKIVLQHGQHAARLPLMIGPTPSPKKGFYDQCREKLLRQEPIDMLEGFYRSALSFSDAAELLCRLLFAPQIPSVINVCGDDALSKYELGCRLAEHIGVSAELVRKTPVSESERFYLDKRAASALMDNTLLKETLHLDSVPFQFD